MYIYIKPTNALWKNVFLIHISSHQNISVYSRPSSGCPKNTNKTHNKLLTCAGKTNWWNC